MSKVTDAPRQGAKNRKKLIRLRDIAVAFVVTAAIVLGLGAILIARSPAASANPDVGCETIHWGFLGGQRRTICDGPKNADGWLRGREIWVPAGYVPGYSYCGRYSCSSSGGYYRERGTVALETYWVTDATVLGDEPGWLPPGTMVIR